MIWSMSEVVIKVGSFLDSRYNSYKGLGDTSVHHITIASALQMRRVAQHQH